MIAATDITAGYGNGADILHGISIEAPRELVTILGPNGCGKSTLLKSDDQIAPTTLASVIDWPRPSKSTMPRADPAVARGIRYQRLRRRSCPFRHPSLQPR